jgi:hypothetical protein
MRLFAAMPIAAVLLTACSFGGDEPITYVDTTQSTVPTPAVTAEDAVEAEPTFEITESGFAQDEWGVWATSMVHNVGGPGAFATVTFNVFDANNQLLATMEQVEQLVSEEGWTAIGTSTELEGVQVARVEAHLAVEDFGLSDEDPLPDLPPFDGAMAGDSKASFVLNNDTGEDWANLRVGIICRDDAGTIQGGGVDYPTSVPAGTQYMIQDSTLIYSASATSCTAYPRLSGY